MTQPLPEDVAPEFERIVKFEPGYNYLHETGPNRSGQHGMGIRFILVGSLGAAQFLMNTSWTPLGEVDERAGASFESVHCDHFDPNYARFGLIRPPRGNDLGYHWSEPNYEGQDAMKCDLLPAGECYYDGSGLAADDVLKDFIKEGEPAVWRWLEKRYQWCIESVAELRARDAAGSES